MTDAPANTSGTCPCDSWYADTDGRVKCDRCGKEKKGVKDIIGIIADPQGLRTIANEVAEDLLGGIQYGDSRDNPEWRRSVVRGATAEIEAAFAPIAQSLLIVVEALETISKHDAWAENDEVCGIAKAALARIRSLPVE